MMSLPVRTTPPLSPTRGSPDKERESQTRSVLDILEESLNRFDEQEHNDVEGPRGCIVSPIIPDHTKTTEWIMGIEVLFPYDRILPPQRQVMMLLIKAALNKKHAIIESPTGTGKTASLLCGVLAFQRKHKIRTGETVKVFYCTRTHSQVAQVVGELSRSSYRPSMVCLGSRQRLCPHAVEIIGDSLALKDLTSKCRNAVRVVESTRRTFRRDQLKRGVAGHVIEETERRCNFDYPITDTSDRRQPGGPCLYYQGMVKRSFSARLHRQTRPRLVVALDDKKSVRGRDQSPDSHLSSSRHSGTTSPILVSSGSVISDDDDLPICSCPEHTDPRSGLVDVADMLEVCAPTKVFKFSGHANPLTKPNEVNESKPLSGRKATKAGLQFRHHNLDQFVTPTAHDEGDSGHEVACTECKLGDSSSFLNSHMDETVIGCPYYSSQILAKKSDLVICPYQFVLDPFVLAQMRLHIEDSVIIFDEAHNIEDVCRDSGSVDITLQKMVALLNWAFEIRASTEAGASKYNLEANAATRDAISLVINILKPIAGLIKQQQLQHTRQGGTGARAASPDDEEEEMCCWGMSGQESRTRGCSSLFETINVTSTEAGVAQEGLNTVIVRYLADPIAVSTITEPWTYYSVCESLLQILSVALDNPANYAVSITRKAPDCGLLDEVVTLHFWLLNPGVLFERVSQKARSVILTSGTLSPLESFASELGPGLSNRLMPALQANHVVGLQQLKVPVLSHLVQLTSQPIEALCVYNNLHRFDFIRALGETLHRIAAQIPGGILIFLPSYTYLSKVTDIWRNGPIWSQLERTKKVIVIEPKSQEVFEQERIKYRDAVDSKGHALCFAVYRGKMSEGMSFNDNYARGVICVGIPFPASRNLLVLKKKEFNNQLIMQKIDPLHAITPMDGTEPLTSASPTTSAATSRRTHWVSGDRWYQLQAYRALNQAMGRCIRHR
eukprot:GHVN01067577.1.p1 GENE.GHVN01067577.1~~GHVN01067577.1.p1  ORF type:complete len:953 (+),score=72.25 GHVN01067577.1:2973-5831(+)